MAKRELSSTLKNLKFMQRAAQKDENAKKEDAVVGAGDFPSCSALKRCVVIMEGDPHPGATSGRMSFLSFNSSIDKLNQEASGNSENDSAATSSGRLNEMKPSRLDNVELDPSSAAGNGDLKRKQGEVAAKVQYPNKCPETIQGNQDSSFTGSRHSQKQQKRGNLDWNVLRPSKCQNRRR